MFIDFNIKSSLKLIECGDGVIDGYIVGNFDNKLLIFYLDKLYKDNNIFLLTHRYYENFFKNNSIVNIYMHNLSDENLKNIKFMKFADIENTYLKYEKFNAIGQIQTTEFILSPTSTSIIEISRTNKLNLIFHSEMENSLKNQINTDFKQFCFFIHLINLVLLVFLIVSFVLVDIFLLKFIPIYFILLLDFFIYILLAIIYHLPESILLEHYVNYLQKRYSCDLYLSKTS